MKSNQLVQQPDLLLDTSDVQARIDAEAERPVRYQIGSFTVPIDADEREVRRRAARAANALINVLAKRGMELVSRIELYGPFACYDIRDSQPDIARAEYRLRGLFKYTKSLKKVRIELPPGAVRRDSEQTLSVHDAIKFWGLPKVVDESLRPANHDNATAPA